MLKGTSEDADLYVRFCFFIHGLYKMYIHMVLLCVMTQHSHKPYCPEAH